MGYDLHITRRKDWSAEGADITAEEWLAFVKSNPDMKLLPEHGPYFATWANLSKFEGPWLDWALGQIYSKNPDSALIDKMVTIAKHFDAIVQGDDGEIYDGGNLLPKEPAISFKDHVTGWFSRMFCRMRPVKIEHPELPFGVGDRVRDLWGNEHTVIEIDPKAEHGMGIIRTIRNSDDTKHGYAMIAHGLTPITNKKEE